MEHTFFSIFAIAVGIVLVSCADKISRYSNATSRPFSEVYFRFLAALGFSFLVPKDVQKYSANVFKYCLVLIGLVFVILGCTNLVSPFV